MRNETIPFITLPNWVKAAAQCGFNIEPIFRRLGIETDLIHLEEARLAPETLDEIMEACVAQSKDQYFPFVLGETFAFEYLSDLETFVTTSRNLREASRVFTWLREFVNPLMDVRLEERAEDASLVNADPPDAMLKRYYSESMFAGIMKFARMLLGENPGFGRVCFRDPRPEAAIDYEGFFGMPVFFGQPRNEIIFPRELLDKPLKGDFPALHRQAEFRIEKKKMSQPASKAGLSAAVLGAFAADARMLGEGIERVAAVLKMHPRTLQRRLQDEQTSFFELQDRARYQAAVEALEKGAPDLESLSERLGFSDRRSFTRAFKRWSGLSPSSFRRTP
jgi:AraC-like DNA-binding protein